MNYVKHGLLVFNLLFFLSACQSPVERSVYPLQYSDTIMGTTFTIKAPVLPAALTSQQLEIQIKTLLNQLDGQMSTYKQDSELSRFNQSQSLEWQTVSHGLYEVLQQAEAVSLLSKGAFDITVGPLVNLWGFGSDNVGLNAPSEDAITQQLTTIGFKLLNLNAEMQQIKKQQSELYLDLSAIAKGYAVDRVGLLLEQQGVLNYMVEIGGELRLKGRNIQGKPWRIGVEKPTAEQRMLQKVLALTDISLATSGDYRNFFEVDGVRFSHTIDPRTGRPITHKLASVTILSDTTMKADALATALMVLGEKEGFQLAEQQQLSALFIIKTEAGFREQATAAFREKLR